MLLRPLTNGSLVTGTSKELTTTSKTFGGVLISVDGTNAATVIVRKCSVSGETTGDIIFKVVTLTGQLIQAPIQAGTDLLYVSVSGTAAAAQFYEWVE